MPGLTSYSTHLIDAVLRAEPITFPSDGVIVSLHTQDPTATGTVGEVASPSYQRVAIPITAWAESVNGRCTLLTDIPWPTSGTNDSWGVITHVVFWDENGHPWFRGALTSPRAVPADTIFHLGANDSILGIA